LEQSGGGGGDAAGRDPHQHGPCPDAGAGAAGWPITRGAGPPAGRAHLKLWAPVEAQLRASFDARQQARAERAEHRATRVNAERPALPDRLERMSKRLTERAERAKALAEAMRPFYAALTDEQKVVANVVMRQALGGPGGRRGFMRHASGADQR
jgi:hypothetical protein